MNCMAGFVGSWLLWAACLAANAADVQWQGKATALGGVPVADGDGNSFRMTLQPGLKWQLSNALSLKAEVRLRALLQQHERRNDAEMRELTVAWRSGDATLTLGAQQLNWGRMDILRVTDIVNPVDQHDLFYEEMPEAKLALWMANAEWQLGSGSLQLVLAPHVPVDRLPRRFEGFPVRVREPADSPRNATYAVRYGFEAAGWNADVLAIRGWQSLPSLHPVLGPQGVALQGVPTRQDSVGFSADKPLGTTVLRLEGLYARTSNAGELLSNDAHRRTLSLGAGLDVRSGPWFVAGQLIGARVVDGASGGDDERDQLFASLIVQRKWLQDRLSGRALHIRETAHGSSWSSLQLSYELSPHQILLLQGDWFQGPSGATFGAFSGRSRIAASMRWQY
ncbi:hypothetical protein [Azohydromonas aeria]|uniref:hypothetical protein n=1 Tax=Azohydromonas aeria TaxID=2590212 RepID=UPI0012F77BF6|nr:hypothetical protein [Azohydromonas aeria]